jgi:hypothetical protein
LSALVGCRKRHLVCVYTFGKRLQFVIILFLILTAASFTFLEITSSFEQSRTASQDIPRLLWNPKVHYHVKESAIRPYLEPKASNLHLTTLFPQDTLYSDILLVWCPMATGSKCRIPPGADKEKHPQQPGNESKRKEITECSG